MSLQCHTMAVDLKVVVKFNFIKEILLWQDILDQVLQSHVNSASQFSERIRTLRKEITLRDSTALRANVKRNLSMVFSSGRNRKLNIPTVFSRDSSVTFTRKLHA